MLALLLILTLSACGASEESAAKETAAPVVPLVEGRPSTPWREAANTDAGDNFLREIGMVAADLSDGKWLNDGISTCQDLYDKADAVKRVKVRFSSGDRPVIDDTMAAAIVASAVKNLCPEFK